MTKSRFVRGLLAFIVLLVPLWLNSTSAQSLNRQPDLADAVAGQYFGDVISDSKGSSRSDVTLTVAKAGKNRVRVTSDYARLPAVEVALEKAMDKIMNADGSTVFLFDSAKSPPKLDVSFHNEVSWSGEKQ